MQHTDFVFPLGKVFGQLTKLYISILSEKLADIPLDRYYFPYWLIATNSGKMNQKEFAERLQTDKVTTFRIVDYLEKNGFIKKLANSDDRRAHQLHTTNKGLQYVDRIEQAIKDTDELFLSLVKNKNLFFEELADLMHQLSEISTNNISLIYDKIKTTPKKNKK